MVLKLIPTNVHLDSPNGKISSHWPMLTCIYSFPLEHLSPKEKDILLPQNMKLSNLDNLT